MKKCDFIWGWVAGQIGILNEGQSHRFGFVLPLGVEAFPFAFQNAGLFFEAAPFCAWTTHDNANLGIRTVAGFAFYFIRREKKE